MLMANGAAEWYKEITKQGIASPISNRKKLVTTKAFKAYSREILSWIAQLKIDNGDIGEYLQKDSLKKTITTVASLRLYNILPLKRKALLMVPSELGSAQLLNRLKKPQAIKEYLP